MNKVEIKNTNYQDNLEAIENIRIRVFQQEQGVDPALEFDGYDDYCVHFIAYLAQKPIGTTRIRYIEDVGSIPRSSPMTISSNLYSTQSFYL